MHGPRGLRSAACDPRGVGRQGHGGHPRPVQRAAADIPGLRVGHYVSEGVGELDQDKLTPLLRFKYHNSIADTIKDLGRPEEIGQMFAGFQRFLYQAVGQA